MSTADVIGYIAGAITTFTFLPQVIKTWKEKSAKDISILMFVIAAVNEILWIIYGVMEDSLVIILTNAILLVMALLMITFKLRFDKNG